MRIYGLLGLLAFRRSTPRLLAGLLGVPGASPRGALVTNVGAGLAPRFAWPLMRRARTQALLELASAKSAFLPFGIKGHYPAIFASADAD